MRKLKAMEVFSHRQKQSSLRECGGKTGDFTVCFEKVAAVERSSWRETK